MFIVLIVKFYGANLAINFKKTTKILKNVVFLLKYYNWSVFFDVLIIKIDFYNDFLIVF